MDGAADGAGILVVLLADGATVEFPGVTEGAAVEFERLVGAEVLLPDADGATVKFPGVTEGAAVEFERFVGADVLLLDADGAAVEFPGVTEGAAVEFVLLFSTCRKFKTELFTGSHCTTSEVKASKSIMERKLKFEFMIWNDEALPMLDIRLELLKPN